MKTKFHLRISLLLAVLSVAFVVASCGDDDDDDDDASSGGYTDVSVTEAKELIDENPDLVVLDVSPYFDDGHILGAVNYPVGDGTLDDAISSLDAQAMYLVYCHGDSPAISAANKLVSAGFEDVYRLVGNYQAWVDAGYPIEM